MSRTLNGLPEAFVSHTEISRAVHRGVKAGRLRRIGSRLYTGNFEEAPRAAKT